MNSKKNYDTFKYFYRVYVIISIFFFSERSEFFPPNLIFLNIFSQLKMLNFLSFISWKKKKKILVSLQITEV